MMKRILALAIAPAIVGSPAIVLGALYQREHAVPPVSDYVPLCGEYTGRPCASLETLYVEGGVLCLAGASLCMLAVLIGALLLLRLTRWRRLAAGVTLLAAMSGASSIWLSQQALHAFQRYSLVPWIYPRGAFTGIVSGAEKLQQYYLLPSLIAAGLLMIVLIISLALLWSATNPRQTDALEAGAERRHWRGPALLIFSFALLAPAVALGIVFEIARPAPCAQNTDPACISLNTMVAAGAVMRGAGIVLVGLAITLSCALFRRFHWRQPLTLGLVSIALASGLWLMWYSQRALDGYFSLPWNAAAFPARAVDGRVAALAHLALIYTLWSAGAVALAATITIAGALIARGGNGRDVGAVPLAPAR